MTKYEIELVKKAQKGDDDAYILLFQRYEKQLYRTAFIYVRNENDTLDIIQETAYRSFKALQKLNNPEFFQSWLVKICISCAIDSLRKNKKIVLVEDIEENEYQVQALYDSELDFLQMLTNLRVDEKNVVILKYYYDYTFEKISRVLNIPIGTAKTILYKAIKKLKLEHIQETEREAVANG